MHVVIEYRQLYCELCVYMCMCVYICYCAMYECTKLYSCVCVHHMLLYLRHTVDIPECMLPGMYVCTYVLCILDHSIENEVVKYLYIYNSVCVFVC